MRIKTGWWLLLGVLGTLPAMAQQPGQYSLFMLNTYHWNPAAAGVDDALMATAGYRQQWSGFVGAPESQYVLVQAPLTLLGGGVGLRLENDALGAERATTYGLAFNRHLRLNDNLLSLGLGVGFFQYRLDGAALRTPEGLYSGGLFSHEDQLLPLTSQTATTPTFELGVYWKTPRYQVGLGVRHLTNPNLTLQELNLQLQRTFFLTAGAQFELGSKWLLAPALLVRTDAIQLQTDLGVILHYNDNIFGGVTLRGYNSNSLDAVAIMGGLRFNQRFTLAYAYDVTLSSLQRVSSGSHEIGLHYRIKEGFSKRRPPQIIYNPRAL